jgi:hypothetical protein
VYLESSPYSKCAVVARPPGLTDPSNATLVGLWVEILGLFGVGFDVGGGFCPDRLPSGGGCEICAN